jgi:RNA-directed DNA polymerase
MRCDVDGASGHVTMKPSICKRSTFYPRGFRPGRSAHQAVRYAQSQIRSGKTWVVDLDLDAFFDRVNHNRLTQRLYRHLPERGLIQLINRYLKAGVMIDGQCRATVDGVPQGGPLSPVLSNVVLDELDWELHRRGHAFARYADDGAPRRREGVLMN